ncbi:hypothetical protein KIPB_000080, partial [Kipferlia bialata]|eukprot:g80.t1
MDSHGAAWIVDPDQIPVGASIPSIRVDTHVQDGAVSARTPRGGRVVGGSARGIASSRSTGPGQRRGHTPVHNQQRASSRGASRGAARGTVAGRTPRSVSQLEGPPSHRERGREREGRAGVQGRVSPGLAVGREASRGPMVVGQRERERDTSGSSNFSPRSFTPRGTPLRAWGAIGEGVSPSGIPTTPVRARLDTPLGGGTFSTRLVALRQKEREREREREAAAKASLRDEESSPSPSPASKSVSLRSIRQVERERERERNRERNRDLSDSAAQSPLAATFDSALSLGVRTSAVLDLALTYTSQGSRKPGYGGITSMEDIRRLVDVDGGRERINNGALVIATWWRRVRARRRIAYVRSFNERERQRRLREAFTQWGQCRIAVSHRKRVVRQRFIIVWRKQVGVDSASRAQKVLAKNILRRHLREWRAWAREEAEVKRREAMFTQQRRGYVLRAYLRHWSAWAQYNGTKDRAMSYNGKAGTDASSAALYTEPGDISLYNLPRRLHRIPQMLVPMAADSPVWRRYMRRKALVWRNDIRITCAVSDAMIGRPWLQRWRQATALRLDDSEALAQATAYYRRRVLLPALVKWALYKRMRKVREREAFQRWHEVTLYQARLRRLVKSITGVYTHNTRKMVFGLWKSYHYTQEAMTLFNVEEAMTLFNVERIIRNRSKLYMPVYCLASDKPRMLMVAFLKGLRKCAQQSKAFRRYVLLTQAVYEKCRVRSAFMTWRGKDGSAYLQRMCAGVGMTRTNTEISHLFKASEVQYRGSISRHSVLDFSQIYDILKLGNRELAPLVREALQSKALVRLLWGGIGRLYPQHMLEKGREREREVERRAMVRARTLRIESGEEVDKGRPGIVGREDIPLSDALQRFGAASVQDFVAKRETMYESMSVTRDTMRGREDRDKGLLLNFEARLRARQLHEINPQFSLGPQSMQVKAREDEAGNYRDTYDLATGRLTKALNKLSSDEEPDDEEEEVIPPIPEEPHPDPVNDGESSSEGEDEAEVAPAVLVVPPLRKESSSESLIVFSSSEESEGEDPYGPTDLMSIEETLTERGRNTPMAERLAAMGVPFGTESDIEAEAKAEAERERERQKEREAEAERQREREAEAKRLAAIAAAAEAKREREREKERERARAAAALEAKRIAEEKERERERERQREREAREAARRAAAAIRSSTSSTGDDGDVDLSRGMAVGQRMGPRGTSIANHGVSVLGSGGEEAMASQRSDTEDSDFDQQMAPIRAPSRYTSLEQADESIEALHLPQNNGVEIDHPLLRMKPTPQLHFRPTPKSGVSVIEAKEGSLLSDEEDGEARAMRETLDSIDPSLMSVGALDVPSRPKSKDRLFLRRGGYNLRVDADEPERTLARGGRGSNTARPSSAGGDTTLSPVSGSMSMSARVPPTLGGIDSSRENSSDLSPKGGKGGKGGRSRLSFGSKADSDGVRRSDADIDGGIDLPPKSRLSKGLANSPSMPSLLRATSVSDLSKMQLKTRESSTQRKPVRKQYHMHRSASTSGAPIPAGAFKPSTTSPVTKNYKALPIRSLGSGDVTIPPQYVHELPPLEAHLDGTAIEGERERGGAGAPSMRGMRHQVRAADLESDSDLDTDTETEGETEGEREGDVQGVQIAFGSDSEGQAIQTESEFETDESEPARGEGESESEDTDYSEKSDNPPVHAPTTTGTIGTVHSTTVPVAVPVSLAPPGAGIPVAEDTTSDIAGGGRGSLESEGDTRPDVPWEGINDDTPPVDRPDTPEEEDGDGEIEGEDRDSLIVSHISPSQLHATGELILNNAKVTLPSMLMSTTPPPALPVLTPAPQHQFTPARDTTTRQRNRKRLSTILDTRKKKTDNTTAARLIAILKDGSTRGKRDSGAGDGFSIEGGDDGIWGQSQSAQEGESTRAAYSQGAKRARHRRAKPGPLPAFPLRERGDRERDLGYGLGKGRGGRGETERVGESGIAGRPGTRQGAALQRELSVEPYREFDPTHTVTPKGGHMYATLHDTQQTEGAQI